MPERTVPDSRFSEWLKETFVTADGALSNIHHEHLLDANIGVLWTNAVNVSKQRHVLATAEIPMTMGNAWKRSRSEQQLRDWFHFDPDFVLTFYAPEVRNLDGRAFCALVEHELYHCAQKQDRYGAPMFNRETGQPIYAMRGHDVEEFVGVVARYGVTTRDLQEMVDAANRAPTIRDEAIARACGTCLAKAA